VDLLVLDTDSRSRPEAEAIRRVRDFAVALKMCGVSDVFKKTDSVLRGHVRAEIDTLLDVMGFDTARLVPANPTFGRIIRGGIYYINGVPLDETSFADDPEYPAATSAVEELLGFPARIGIPDAETDETLDVLAAFHRGVMPAGGADYFRSWLRIQGHALKRSSSMPCGAVRLAVCGSSSAGSRGGVDARAAEGVPVISMPDDVFSGNNDIGKWADAVRERLTEEERVIVSICKPLIPDARELRRLCSCVAALTHRVAPDLSGGLAVEGGATASAIFDRLQWKRIDVLSEVIPGVVRLRAPGGRIVVVKPGSYAWPDGFFRKGEGKAVQEQYVLH
jgi:hypothetical protein